VKDERQTARINAAKKSRTRGGAWGISDVVQANQVEPQLGDSATSKFTPIIFTWQTMNFTKYHTETHH